MTTGSAPSTPALFEVEYQLEKKVLTSFCTIVPLTIEQFRNHLSWTHIAELATGTAGLEGITVIARRIKK
jgi:hypothetical protein